MKAVSSIAAFACTSLLTIALARGQENPFPKLIGTWRNVDTHVTIIVTSTGDVFTRGGAISGSIQRAIGGGGDFEIQGKLQSGSAIRCVYDVSFLTDKSSDWGLTQGEPVDACPKAGRYFRVDTSMPKDPVPDEEAQTAERDKEAAPSGDNIHDALMSPPLPDIWIGSSDAPTTIIEYASMTCDHCATFHNRTWPILKARYIDTGRVRFVLREFPLDPLAKAGFMLARCAGPGRRNSVLDLLFDQQKNWAFVDRPVEALENLAKRVGFSHTSFESCLNDKGLYDSIQSEFDDALNNISVDSAPTFFINGEKQAGNLGMKEIESMMNR